jgi:hypothetical protein
VSLTALEISFDNPVLHRNLSGSFEDEDDDEHEDEVFMLIPSDQDAYATLLLSLAVLDQVHRSSGLTSPSSPGNGITSKAENGRTRHSPTPGSRLCERLAPLPVEFPKPTTNQ